MQQISEKDFQCKIHMTGPERLHDIPTYSWKSKCPNREDKTFKPQSAPNHTSSNSIERTSIKNKDEGCPNNVLRESKSANIHPIKNSNSK